MKIDIHTFWVGYVLLASVSFFCAYQLTRVYKRRWLKFTLLPAVLAVFLAPSVVIRGYGLGPAWMALLDAKTAKEAMLLGIAPILVTWALISALAIVGSHFLDGSASEK